jgi:hypothetical protein
MVGDMTDDRSVATVASVTSAVDDDDALVGFNEKVDTTAWVGKMRADRPS